MTKVKCPKCDLPNPAGQSVCSRCQTILPRVNLQGDDAQSGEREVLFRKGQIIANRYTVIDMIGRGGMGCIYRVHDNTLNEDVALKTLLPQFVRDKLVVERFYNEARIARQLSHVNIVRVHDIGFAGNILYISMEYLRGKSLRGMLDSLPAGQRMPLRMTLSIMDQLCAALEYAHQYTVHRDIKPENVMITRDGSIKLMDFGISKLMANTQLTAASMVMGTPYYMSPEQLKDSSAVDARADIYSVGVMLYEMLTGNLPTGIIKPASEVLREVPPSLDPIVARCVEPDPRNRFASASELRAALAPIRELIESGTDPRAAVKAKARESGNWGRKLAGAAAIAAIFAIAAGGIWALERLHDNAQASAGADSSAAVSGELSGTARFETLAKVVPALSREAMGAAGDETVPVAIVRMGDDFWREAQKLHDAQDPTAIDKAWHAVQCYLGVLERPQGMVFIPPGRVAISLDPARPDQVYSAEIDGFYIDEKEVTNAEFTAFVQKTQWRSPVGPPGDPSLPVANVTFYDAQAYAAHKGLKLPTEAQWVRATCTIDGASPAFPWGDDPALGVANTANPANPMPAPTPPGATVDDRTEFGCLDMAGNMSEWTGTFYATTVDGAGAEVEASDGERPPFNRNLVLRGGSFLWQPRPNSFHSPLKDRMPILYQQRFPNVGFRCVKPIPRNLAILKNTV